MEENKADWSVCGKIIKTFFSSVNADGYQEITSLAAG